MINIVVPVKNPSGAKQRLAGALSESQRCELAVMLYEQVLETLNFLTPRPHVLVVTDDPQMADIAKRHGAAALLERKAEGETRAVEKATKWSMERGFDAQVVIPGDMARLDPNDMSELLSLKIPNPAVVLCPAVGDDGTNAILTSPPNALPYRFGDRSFHDYLARAEKLGIPSTVLRLPSLVLDLDTPDDLAAFLQSKERTPAHELLARWGITSVGRNLARDRNA